MSLTLREMVGKLESLTRQQLTISQGLDVLEEQAQNQQGINKLASSIGV